MSEKLKIQELINTVDEKIKAIDIDEPLSPEGYDIVVDLYTDLSDVLKNIERRLTEL